jgi:hypothetical protein
MYRYQSWLIVSILCLVGALIFPTYVILFATPGQIFRQAIKGMGSEHSTSTGVVAFLHTMAQSQLLNAVLIVEAILAALFAVTLWYAIKCRSEDLCHPFPNPTANQNQ